MERKNTVLLTVIAIATLLVAVVGATFAYFTATTTPSTESGVGNVTTAKTDNTKFTFNGSDVDYKYLNYPGGLALIGAHAAFEKTTTDTDKNYKATYDLEIKYKNETGTDLIWALYVVEDDNIDAADPSCNLIVDTVSSPTEVRYWYADSTDNAQSENKNCTLKGAELTDLTSQVPIAYGFLRKQTSDVEKTVSDVGSGAQDELSMGVDKFISTHAEEQHEIYNPAGAETNPLENRELKTTDASGSKDKYYYLVVQYPNNDKQDQTTSDKNKAIQVSLGIKEGSIKIVEDK